MFPFQKGTFDDLKSYAASGSLLNRIFAALRARTPIAGANVLLKDVDGGFEIHATGGGAGTGPCAFGDVLELPDDARAIVGGVVYCGDKNFNVPRYDLALGTDGDWLVYLELACESNRDDEGEIFLPGIKTSSETSPGSFWNITTDASYPANTNPPVSTGIGTIIIPLGSLTITDGVPTFVPTACGQVTVNQCGGTLSHTRG
jgi:hypothetical protein